LDNWLYALALFVLLERHFHLAERLWLAPRLRLLMTLLDQVLWG
jgi:hypothetical protein